MTFKVREQRIVKIKVLTDQRVLLKSQNKIPKQNDKGYYDQKIFNLLAFTRCSHGL